MKGKTESQSEVSIGSTNTIQASWTVLLRPDFALRNFEIGFFIFSLVYLFLILGSHLPLSSLLAKIFLKKLLEVVLAVYACTVGIILFRLVRKLLSEGGSSIRSKAIIIDIIQPYWTLGFLMITIRRVACLLGTLFFFLHLKHIILFLHPANFDALYWMLDRKLHFGVQPNIWAMDLLYDQHTTAVLIDWLYIKYFNYQLLVSIFFLFEFHGRKLTDLYFFAYCTVWSLGGLGYLVTPTDGPCYAVLLESSVDEANIRKHVFDFPITRDVPTSYVEQYQESKIWTAKTYQFRLWKDRQKFISGKSKPGMFYGIAAVPSLHVAVVVLISIFLFKTSVLAGVIASLYALITLIGSVFLQWHYAIDGYIGALLAVFVYLIAKKIPEPFAKRLRT